MVFSIPTRLVMNFKIQSSADKTRVYVITDGRYSIKALNDKARKGYTLVEVLRNGEVVLYYDTPTEFAPKIIINLMRHISKGEIDNEY